jgi:thiol-disulfide isomerase/thioredoxin
LQLTAVEADLPENQDLLDKYKVVSLPTFILLKDNEVVGRIVGAQPELTMRNWIKTVL